MEKPMMSDFTATGIMRGASSVLIVKTLGLFLTLGLSVLLARLLNPSGFGQYSYATEMLLFLSIPVSHGLPNLITREVARFKHNSEIALFHGLMRWSALVVILVFAVVAVTVFLLGLYSVSNTTQPFNFVLLGLPIILLTGFLHIGMGALRGIGKPAIGFVPQAVVRPLGTAVIVMFIALFQPLGSLTATSALLAFQVAQLLALFFGVYWFTTSLPTIFRRPSSVTYKSTEWLQESLAFLLLGGASLVTARVGIVIVGAILNSEQVAYLKLATTGALTVSFVANGVNASIAPKVSAAKSFDDLRLLQPVIKSAVRRSGVLAVGLVFIFALFGRFIISTIYGTVYLEVFPHLVILSIAQLFNTLAGPAGQVMNMQGYQRVTAKIQILVMMATILLTWGATISFGLYGASIATAIGLIAWNVLLARNVRRIVGISTTVLRQGL